MSVTRAQRDEAYENASEIAQHLCDSPESGEQLYEIAKRHAFADSAQQYRAYALAVGDVILGFYEDRELPALLMQEAGLDGKTARAVTADLLEFLAPLHGEPAAAPSPAASPSPTAATAPAADESAAQWASEIAAAEAALAATETLHTYASDQAAVSAGEARGQKPPMRPERVEPEHRSSQSDLLQRSDTTNRARWGQ